MKTRDRIPEDDWGSGENYVPALRMSYRYDLSPSVLILTFDDGVSYTLAESLTLARGNPSPEDIRAVHYVKKLFDGDIL